MQKWLIILLSLVLTALCATALLLVAGGARFLPQSAETTAVPVAATLVTSTATEPTTEPAQPTESLPPVPEPPDMSQSTATHLFVYDTVYDRMLYTLGDQNERIEPASLTKLFTAYVALQHLDPSRVVTVGEEAGWVAKDSSVAAVSEGCRLSAGLILQGMLMQSGNDAAYAIAVAAGRAIKGDDTLAAKPAYDAFIAEMNRQLESLGFTATHFTNPDGYHDDDHYTTPAELLRITQLAVTEPLIRECCSMESAQVYYDSGQEYTWKNTNWLIRTDVEDYYCPEATGLKTGSTSKAGMCLLATFSSENANLIVGVLGCEEMEDRFVDALTLFYHYR